MDARLGVFWLRMSGSALCRLFHHPPKPLDRIIVSYAHYSALATTRGKLPIVSTSHRHPHQAGASQQHPASPWRTGRARPGRPGLREGQGREPRRIPGFR